MSQYILYSEIDRKTAVSKECFGLFTGYKDNKIYEYYIDEQTFNLVSTILNDNLFDINNYMFYVNIDQTINMIIQDLKLRKKQFRDATCIDSIPTTQQSQFTTLCNTCNLDCFACCCANNVTRRGGSGGGNLGSLHDGGSGGSLRYL